MSRQKFLRGLFAHDLKINGDVVFMSGNGAPTNGSTGTGANDAGPGSFYIDYTNNAVYQQVGTKAVPTWTLRGDDADLDTGRAPVGYLYLTSTVSDAETVTINSRVYEFKTSGAAGAGHVKVDVSGGVTADAAITALVAAINADAGRSVDAIAWTGNSGTTAGCSFVAIAATATNYTLATTAAAGVVSAAAFVGAAVPVSRDIFAYQYAVTAADVTTLARTGGHEVVVAGITATSAPVLTGLVARTSAGVVKDLATLAVTLRQVNTNFYALTVTDPSALLASGDLLGFTLTL